MISLLNLSPKGFFDTYMEHPSTFGWEKLYDQKGEKRIDVEQWTLPPEEERQYPHDKDLAVSKV